LQDDFEACITHLRFPLAHRQAIRTTDEMDKRFFFMTETTIAEIAVRPFFCSAAPRAILPSRPSISQPPRAGAVKAGRICGHRKAWP
jgi:hypothetical protein